MSPNQVSDPADLYVLPPEEFTSARNDLRDRLREEGDVEEAQRVAKIRKPTVAAWALNRAARSDPDLVERLVQTHRKVREAENVQTMQEASQERRRLVTEIVEAALAELTASERAATPQTRERINNTVLAVAADPEGETMLASGTLVRDLEPSGGGWGDFALIPPTPPDPDQIARDEIAELRKRTTQLEEKAVQAEKRVEQAEKTLVDAKKRAEAARDEADEAAEAVRKAEANASED